MALAAKPTGKVIDAAAAAKFRPAHLYMFAEGSGSSAVDTGEASTKVHGTFVGTGGGPDWVSDGVHGPVIDCVGANLDYIDWAAVLTGATSAGGTCVVIAKIPNTHAADGMVIGVGNSTRTDRKAYMYVSSGDSLRTFWQNGATTDQASDSTYDAANDAWVMMTWAIKQNEHKASLNGGAFVVRDTTALSGLVYPMTGQDLTRTCQQADSNGGGQIGAIQFAAIMFFPGQYWSNADVAEFYNSENPWDVFLTDPVIADFSAGPTVNSTTNTAYTIGATLDETADLYVGAFLVGDDAPTDLSDMTARARFGAMKAFTRDVADTIVLTSDDSPAHPHYDLYFILDNAAGESAPEPFLNKYLSPLSGKEYIEVDDLTPPTGGLYLLEGLSAALADVMIVDSTLYPGSLARTVNGDGTVDVPSTTKKWVRGTYDLFRSATGVFEGSAYFHFNNSAPVVGAPAAQLLQRNVVPPAFSLRSSVQELDVGDDLTFAYSSGDAIHTGCLIDANGDRALTAPTVAGSGATVYSVTDTAGHIEYITYSWQVANTAAVPTVTNIKFDDGSETDGESLLVAAGFVVGSRTNGFDPTKPNGTILSQSLTGTQIVGTAIDLVINFIPAGLRSPFARPSIFTSSRR